MTRTASLTILTTLLLLSAAARADSIANFTLSGLLVDGSVLNGTMQVNTTTGVVLDLKASVGPPVAQTFFDFRGGYSQGPGYIATGAFHTPDATYPNISLTFPLDSWVNYGGGLICGLQTVQVCGGLVSGIWMDGQVQNIAYLQAGQALPVPEPSTPALFAFGLSVLTAGSRRWLQARARP